MTPESLSSVLLVNEALSGVCFILLSAGAGVTNEEAIYCWEKTHSAISPGFFYVIFN